MFKMKIFKKKVTLVEIVFLLLATVFASSDKCLSEETQSFDENCQEALYLYIGNLQRRMALDPHVDKLFQNWGSKIAELRKKYEANPQKGKLASMAVGENSVWTSDTLLEDCDLVHLELSSMPYQDYTESHCNDDSYGIPVTWKMLSKTKNWKNKYLDHFTFSFVNLKRFSFSEWTLNCVSLYGNFDECDFSNTHFFDVMIFGVISFEQFSSSWNYRYNKLDGIKIIFPYRNKQIDSQQSLKGWNFDGKDISGLRLLNVDMSEASFQGALIASSPAYARIPNPFIAENMTKEELYKTWCYQHKDLSNISFKNHSLDDWDLRKQYLMNSELFANTASRLDLTDAKIENCCIFCPIEKEQLYSTFNYKKGCMMGVTFGNNLDMSHWNLSKLNLTGARFWKCDLTGTNFTDSVITGCTFRDDNNLTIEQVKSTWNYKTGNMSKIRLPSEIHKQLKDEAKAKGTAPPSWP